MATFRGHKLRANPPEVRGQMLTRNRPRQTNTDLLEERERQYHDAISRDVTGARDVTGSTAAGQPRRGHKATGRRHRRPPEPPSELEGTVRAFLEHVISLAVSPPEPAAAPTAVTSDHVTSDSGRLEALPSPGRVKQSSLYLDAVRERALLSSAESRREEEAAVAIQSTWRGHRVRQSLKQKSSASQQPLAEVRPTAKGGQKKKVQAVERGKNVEDQRQGKKVATKSLYTASKVKGTVSRQSRGGRRSSVSTKYSYNMTASRPPKTGVTTAALRT